MPLIARFWDVKSGAIKIGGVDVKEIGSKELMNQGFLCVSG
ncbi:MAG: hypothetical protein ACLTEE_08940 [Anaerobutyricum hallii]